MLVTGFLEMVSSKIFSAFPKLLPDLIGKQHGVYALYKGSRLYYVGLASDLRNRIKQHQRDKHGGKWDKFSLYLVAQANHVKEFETLVMRIASPAGNATQGRLPRADNLRSQLEFMIKTEQSKRLRDLLGTKPSQSRSSKNKNQKGIKLSSSAAILDALARKRLRIRGTYRNQTYYATVNRNGTVRFEGNTYNSLSAAGRAVRKGSTNGWTFWHFKNRRGEWIKLRTLQKG